MNLDERDHPQRVAVAAILFVLLPIIFFLRLPTLTNAFCDPDLGTPAYTARLLLDGRCAYSDAIITKPPGTTALYALCIAIFGPDMRPVYGLAGLFAWACCILLYRILARTVSPGAGLLAATLYAFYQAEMVGAGSCPNFEFWTLAPSLLSLSLLSQTPTWSRRVGAGAAIAVAVAMKQSALFFLVAFAVDVAFRPVTGSRWSAIGSARALAHFGLGIMAGALPFVAMMASVGCAGAAAKILNPLAMFGYHAGAALTSNSLLIWTQWLRLWRSSPALLVATVLSLGYIGAHPWWRNSAAPIRLWFLFAAGATASLLMGGHWYGHYFIVIFPAACLVTGAAFSILLTGRSRRWKAALIVIAFLAVGYDMSTEISWATLSAKGLARDGSPITAEISRRNREFVFERADHNQVASHLEWQPTLLEAADAIRSRLSPGDTVWSLDYLPEMYLYLDAFAPTRHQENFEIVAADDLSHALHNYGLWHVRTDVEVLKSRQELMKALVSNPPRFIFRYAQDCRRHAPFPGRGRVPPHWPKDIWDQPMAQCPPRVTTFLELEGFLQTNYHLVSWKWENVISIYERGEPAQEILAP